MRSGHDPRPREPRGFTLIELMIGVAIIGLLAAISIPAYIRFQGRSRQSEAKVSLKAYFTAAKASFSETNRWKCGACGWAPQDGKYLYNYFLSDFDKFAKGERGCDQTGVENAKQTDPNSQTDEPGGFTASATANLDTDADCDGWNINDANDLTNKYDDVN